ncbi:hypothetical protein B0T17DRAFT_535044 [Bombardia bombarda]|uniref:Uncharacterized protein n=1 Tax=Bombardia bombarda TaxID=252184 RepID=A0AA39WUW0_9PEZI|nr:hypothetical protein B0T17DRAFT_535044 [Bombardia bombarda]
MIVDLSVQAAAGRTSRLRLIDQSLGDAKYVLGRSTDAKTLLLPSTCIEPPGHSRVSCREGAPKPAAHPIPPWDSRHRKRCSSRR